MESSDVLVVEPDVETRNRVGSALEALEFEPIVSGSVAEALERARAGRPTAIIADVYALLTHGGPGGDLTTRVAELRAGVERLRALQPQGGHPEPGSEIPVILTSTGDDASVHAAAIDAGAAAFVRAVEITHTGILRSYMDRFNDARKSMILRRGARPQPITATFDLPDDDLRDGQTGRWDAKRIAPVLGVDLTDLVRAIEANYSTVARTPASEALQPKLAPFANVITMIRQAYASDGDDTGGQAAERARTRTDERLRMWLRRTQPALGDRSPLDALLEPGLAPAVEQWVTRIWLGEPG